MIKKILVQLAGILAFLLGTALGIISVITIIKIIASGNNTTLDIELAAVMIIFFLTALGLIALAGRLLYGKADRRRVLFRQRKERLLSFFEKLKSKTKAKRILLVAAILCLGMIYLLRGTIPELLFLLTGIFCMIAVGTIHAVEADQKGKLKGLRWYRAFSSIIWLYTLPYMIIAFFIMGLLG